MYKGKKWAIIISMIYWTYSKGYQIVTSFSGNNFPESYQILAPVIFWFILMRPLVLAYKVEKAITREKKKTPKYLKIVFTIIGIIVLGYGTYLAYNAYTYRHITKGNQLIQKGDQEGAIKELVIALSSDNFDIKLSAVNALGDIKHSDAVKILIETLNDENELISWFAAIGLENIGRPLVPNDVLEIIENYTEQVTENISYNMSINLLDEGTDQEKIEAAKVLGNMGMEIAIPKLEVLLNNPNELVKDAARQAINKIQKR